MSKKIKKMSLLAAFMLAIASFSMCSFEPEEPIEFPEGLCPNSQPGIKTTDCDFGNGIASYQIITLIGGASGNVDGVGTGAGMGALLTMADFGDEVYAVERTEENGEKRIRKINVETGEVTTLYSESGADEICGGNTTAIISDGVSAIYKDSFYYICGEAVMKYDLSTPSVAPVLLAGDLSDDSFVNGNGTTARFDNPDSVMALSDRLIISDRDNNSLRAISDSGDVTTYVDTVSRPTRMFKDGDNIYLIEDLTYYSADQGISIIDVSNADAPIATTLLNEHNVLDSASIDEEVVAMAFDEDFIYMVSKLYTDYFIEVIERSVIAPSSDDILYIYYFADPSSVQQDGSGVFAKVSQMGSILKIDGDEFRFFDIEDNLYYNSLYRTVAFHIFTYE